MCACLGALSPEAHLWSANARRMPPLFPLRKIKRGGRYVLLAALFVFVGVAAYLEYAATSLWFHSGDSLLEHGVVGVANAVRRKDGGANSEVNDINWMSNYVPQPWRPEYKGQANLHVFEDWCGSSVSSLRKNLHYPLYPHSRLTVKKLAVSPGWTNYGLRIFGYIHPYTDGEFLFAVASDDNCEFWLSLDESPDHLQLGAFVGMTGKEWTAPGEYGKYNSQISKPIYLQQHRRYYFELIHKHDNRGTDHVALAWRLKQDGVRFSLLDSTSLSLYTNESSLKLSEVRHIPQTAASHKSALHKTGHKAEMLRGDPRDTSFQIPLLDRSYLKGVVPECFYSPSYIIKDFPLDRYQGLQFVRLSYIYPNDYTRLTHMEDDNKCFYQANQYFLESRFGFSRYMKLDEPKDQSFSLNYRDYDIRMRGGIAEEEEEEDEDYKLLDRVENKAKEMPDYQDDYDDYLLHRKRKLFSASLTRTTRKRRRRNLNVAGRRQVKNPLANGGPLLDQTNQTVQNSLQAIQQLQNLSNFKNSSLYSPPNPTSSAKQTRVWRKSKKSGKVNVPKRGNAEQNQYQHVPVTTPKQVKQSTEPPGEKIAAGAGPEDLIRRDGKGKMAVVNESIQMEKGVESNHSWKDDGSYQKAKESEKEQRFNTDVDDWLVDGDSEMVYEHPSRVVYDPKVNWARTFHVSHLDFQTLRSDRIDLQCNVSGNLLISESEAVYVVQAFMEKLLQKYPRRFALQRILNVEKRVDEVHGNRYLLELDMLERPGRRVRLVHYVYVLNNPKKHRNQQLHTPPLLLCNPHGFQWNPDATVHFIVPVKNQARWVQKLIMDMEELYKATGDRNFNVIITDYSSNDMDIEQALRDSRLPNSQYIKLTGNFERSAGLQAGVDLITDPHSIVFLCDLHIHFPPGFIDSVRKHCIEGHMAFAPIVMRLNCGATAREPDGYWEINGFGLLGIYKSDLDLIGGMNTKEFTDRWGGEDWELLDRIMKAGLEVERLYLRKFFHHFHSRRGMWNRKMARNT